MIRTAVALVGVLVLAGCSAGVSQLPVETTSKAGTPVTSSAPDPYAVYRANAPKGEPVLSRDDAATRAKLGCGQAFAPGTIDAVLAQAYAAYC